ncbi:hypothetical protein ACXJJ3_24360 [Kribbella sp. WER1]
MVLSEAVDQPPGHRWASSPSPATITWTALISSVVLTSVFVTGLPFAHDQEFHYGAVQTVIANAYLLCAVGLIAQARNSDARIRYTWRFRS